VLFFGKHHTGTTYAKRKLTEVNLRAKIIISDFEDWWNFFQYRYVYIRVTCRFS